MRKLFAAALAAVLWFGIAASIAQVTTNPRLTGVIGTSTTGSGAVVLQTSPTLTTPTLGVATATSINFGGTALSTYTEGTWTPSLGGNATYGIQTGSYTKIGNIVCVKMDLQVGTLGTGSTSTISGLPFSSTSLSPPLTMGYFDTLSKSVVMIVPQATASSTIIFNTLTAAAASLTFNDTVITNATRLVLGGCYTTA